MRLGDRDDEKRPAVLQQGSPDDRLSISQPCPMDNRTPPPPAVATLTMDDLPAAGAELAVIRQGRRPDSSDDLFGSPERGPLLVRIRRDDPPVTPTPARPFESEETSLSLGFSSVAHWRPAASSALQRSAADRREARRQAVPSIRVLMAGHHRPRVARVRIPYAPPVLAERLRPPLLCGRRT
jgi:hypothetical protein